MSALSQTIRKAYQVIQKALAYFKFGQSEKISSPQSSTTKSAQKVASIAITPLPDTLQRDLRTQRKFSLAEAVGREGGSFMKGESTIPRPLRAIAQINQFIITHLSDPASAFSTTLQGWACNDIRLSRQLDTPLVALDQIIASLLLEPTNFCEFARQVAIAHSQITGDRPYFQPLNQPPHPEADYTHAAIRIELSDLQQCLQSVLPPVEPRS